MAIEVDPKPLPDLDAIPNRSTNNAEVKAKPATITEHPGFTTLPEGRRSLPTHFGPVALRYDTPIPIRVHTNIKGSVTSSPPICDRKTWRFLPPLLRTGGSAEAWTFFYSENVFVFTINDASVEPLLTWLQPHIPGNLADVKELRLSFEVTSVFDLVEMRIGLADGLIAANADVLVDGLEKAGVKLERVKFVASEIRHLEKDNEFLKLDVGDADATRCECMEVFRRAIDEAIEVQTAVAQLSELIVEDRDREVD